MSNAALKSSGKGELLHYGQQRGRCCQATVPKQSQWNVQVCMQIDVDCNLVMPRCEVGCAVKIIVQEYYYIKFKLDIDL